MRSAGSRVAWRPKCYQALQISSKVSFTGHDSLGFRRNHEMFAPAIATAEMKKQCICFMMVSSIASGKRSIV